MLKFDKIKLWRTYLITTSPLHSTMAAIKIVALSTLLVPEQAVQTLSLENIDVGSDLSGQWGISTCRLAFVLPLLELLGMGWLPKWHFSKALKGNKYTSHSGPRKAADKPKSLGNEEAAGDREQGLWSAPPYTEESGRPMHARNWTNTYKKP